MVLQINLPQFKYLTKLYSILKWVKYLEISAEIKTMILHMNTLKPIKWTTYVFGFFFTKFNFTSPLSTFVNSFWPLLCKAVGADVKW